MPRLTPPWPAGYTSPPAGAAGSEEGGGGGGSPRKAEPPACPGPRPFAESAGLDSAVVSSYLEEETYVDYRRGCFKFFLVFGLIAAPLGFIVGYLFRLGIANIVASTFSPKVSNLGTSQSITYALHFWNITNPTLAGSPPNLTRVGPYAYNVTTFMWNPVVDAPGAPPAPGGRPLSYLQLPFAEYQPSASCARCAVNDTLFLPNQYWVSTMANFGWDDTGLMTAGVPAALAGLLAGLGETLAGVAATPGLGSAFPGASAHGAALAQWASCGALGGLAVRTLGSPAIDAAFPYTPEFCGWAQDPAPGGAGLPRPAAVAVLPPPCAAAFVAYMSAGGPFAAIGAVKMPAAAFAATLSRLAGSACQAPAAGLLQGYVLHLALTYSRAAVAAAVGPPLAAGSSGPLARLTPDGVAFGTIDPLLAYLAPFLYPPGAYPPAAWYDPNPLLYALFRPLAEAGNWSALAAAVAADAAGAPPPAAMPGGVPADLAARPGGAAGRFFQYTVDDGWDDPSTAGNLLADSNSTTAPVPPGGPKPAPALGAPVSGRLPGAWGFGNLALQPWALRDAPVLHSWSAVGGAVSEPALGLGLGRAVPFEWDGQPDAWRHQLAVRRYALTASAFAPCNATLVPAAAGAAEPAPPATYPAAGGVAAAAAAAACAAGDSVAGVWRATSPLGVTVLYSLPGYAGADPAVLASLGPAGGGAGARFAAASGEAPYYLLDTSVGALVQANGSFLISHAMAPTPRLSPALWHGSPVPQPVVGAAARWDAGLTYWPKLEVGPALLQSDFTNFLLFRLQYVSRPFPRMLTTLVNLGASIMAAIGAWGLAAGRLAQRAARARAGAERGGGGGEAADAAEAGGCGGDGSEGGEGDCGGGGGGGGGGGECCSSPAGGGPSVAEEGGAGGGGGVSEEGVRRRAPSVVV